MRTPDKVPPEKTPEDRAWDRHIRQIRTVFEALHKVVPAEDHKLLESLGLLVEDSMFDTRRAVQRRREP